ncbi:MAG: c-type cytochrome [Candidatus Neomarinimicrobiota bacterium]
MNTTGKLFSGLILLSVLVTAQTVWQNLQVLQFESKAELKQFMEGVAADLGVECVFCHDLRDKSSDEKKHKLVARDMLKMTAGINDQYLNWEGAEKVGCWSCHRGQKEPEKRK